MEVVKLQDEISKLQHELDEAKSTTMVTMCTMENRIEMERRTGNEERATLQQLLEGEATNLKSKI